MQHACKRLLNRTMLIHIRFFAHLVSQLLRHRFMEKASAGDTFKDSASSLYSVASVSQKFTSG